MMILSVQIHQLSVTDSTDIARDVELALTSSHFPPSRLESTSYLDARRQQ